MVFCKDFDGSLHFDFLLGLRPAKEMVQPIRQLFHQGTVQLAEVASRVRRRSRSSRWTIFSCSAIAAISAPV